MIKNLLGNVFLRLCGSLGAKTEGNANFSAGSGRLLRKIGSKMEPEMDQKVLKIIMKIIKILYDFGKLLLK